MLVTFIRTIIVYFFVIGVIRLMGKRQIGELEPSELVVTIIISEVAAMPIQDNSEPLASSIMAIALLLILEVIISYIAYKSRGFRKFLYGTPSILYAKGKIDQKEMERQRFNVNDLMEIVRNNGISTLNEVDFVIVETNGNVSVLLKGENKNVTVKDLNLPVNQEELSYIIVDNGKVNNKSLTKLGLSEKWINKKISENDISDIKDIYCMGADRNGNTFIIRKEK